MHGTTYARVLPLPVKAWTATSLLVSSRGIVMNWTGVGGSRFDTVDDCPLDLFNTFDSESKVEAERGGDSVAKEGTKEGEDGGGEADDDEGGNGADVDEAAAGFEECFEEAAFDDDVFSPAAVECLLRSLFFAVAVAMPD